MTDKLIKLSLHPDSGYYLDDYQKLISTLESLKNKKQKVILLGVSFALLELSEKYSIDLSNIIIMETGGMKGRRKELIREELHNIFNKNFNTPKTHSEYGMTELLSQAYSTGNGIFHCPPWMRVQTREINDPLSNEFKRSGGLCIIDLANIDSCSFIATQDIGKVYPNGSFEVLGRFDNSDIRGCNLLVSL